LITDHKIKRNDSLHNPTDTSSYLWEHDTEDRRDTFKNEVQEHNRRSKREQNKHKKKVIMANTRIKAIDSLPRKWVIKDNNGFYIQPYDSYVDYNVCMQYEADAFRFTEGEAIDFLAQFPKLKSTCKIIRVTK